MKKILAVVLLLSVLLGSAGVAPSWAAQKMTRRQYKKNLAYNKNALPAGWKYEAGYTLWRMQRNLAANQHTYKKYKRDKAWHRNMRNNHRVEDIVLDSLDWTNEEIALFWQNYKDTFNVDPWDK